MARRSLPGRVIGFVLFVPSVAFLGLCAAIVGILIGPAFAVRAIYRRATR